MEAFESQKHELVNEDARPLRRASEFTVHSHYGGDNKPFDVWLKRLTIFKDVQVQYYRVKRVKHCLGLLGSVSAASLLLATVLQHSIIDSLFWLYVVVMSISCLAYPFAYVKTMAYDKQKIDLSRLFYKSNHEVETKEGRLVLIDRGSNKIVAEVNI